ncbi:Cell division control protein 25 [Ceratocystis lukuohia]|uniref:Cell division control protein 25 n=1 Tax=Ceratocystis lukuohia TaxID=2019550 RepID=A0ABR4MD79_9PEZI
MNNLVGAAPPGTMFVRALYNYEADDRTSLSFHEGDIIQVITQLESGWWDGVMNGVRGWFPSNYCQIIESPDEIPDSTPDVVEDDEDDNPAYEDQFDQIEEEHSDEAGMPFDDAPSGDKSRADFWIPQATADGRLFYYNMMTGDRSSELPLESPVSANETGLMDRPNVAIPDRTRLPPEMMARGLMRDEDEESLASISEADGEHSGSSRGPMSQSQSQSQPQTQAQAQAQPHSHSHSHSQPSSQTPAQIQQQHIYSRTDAVSGPPSSSTAQAQPPMIASATSFTTTAFNLPSTANMSKSFFDDGTTPPLTWTRLVQNMKKAIARYREAVTSNDRAQYVARAEDISDHLRLLLAAGSGTTDNHSGQPSIISQNKALYPHFRDMMSKFSKLVISSHIAAADWPNAESVQKCLFEADGVFQGVFNYVEVARQQRGEEIPRLFPGFVIGSITGGSWQNNGIGPRDRIAANFYDDDEGPSEPSAHLDDAILERIDDMKRLLISSLRELDKTLVLNDKIVTPARHELIGNNICATGGRVLDAFKAWISLIENIDLSSMNHSVQQPVLADFFTSKQSIYDNVADVIIGCQAVSGPLADEWSEVRGEALESRLEYAWSHMCSSIKASSNRSTATANGQNPFQEQESLCVAVILTHMKLAGYTNDRSPDQRSQHGRPCSLRSLLPRENLLGISGKATCLRLRRFSAKTPLPRIPTRRLPPHLSLDLEHEISWETKTTPHTVKGGTLEALVEQLTRHDKLDSSFNNTFLLTYRSFTTARELFEMLVKRFSIQPPEGLHTSNYEEWRVKKQMIVRVRVVNILKNWFDNFWMEDYNDDSKQLMRDVYNFARDTVKSAEAPGSAPLMAVLDQRLTGKEAGARRMVQNLDRSVPASIMPKNMKKLKFLDIDVTEFARQLTIIESRLYGKIKATECLNKTWQKKVGEGEPEPAPNVKALILHSNQMTNWVAEMILAQMDLRKRVVVIKHFVSVADKCRSMNNFSTLTSIISALGTAPISRLKRTWDQVPQRSSNMLETMRTLMASTKNFGEYREALHAANPPCIPFFGVYLTDLTFIEDGIPSIIKKQNLINFAKRAKTAEVIRDIQQYQNVGYNLHAVPELQDYILSNMQAAGDVHEMYDKSLQVEPREREDEKIVRYVLPR